MSHRAKSMALPCSKCPLRHWRAFRQRSALEVAAFYFRHEIPAAGIEIDDLHYRTDRRLGVEVGVARGANRPLIRGE